MTKFYRLVTVCLILFSVLSVYATIPNEELFFKSADEGYYFTFANLIDKDGIAKFPELASTFINRKELQIFPSPLRVGHILSTALWFKLFPNTYVSLAKFSLFCFVLFLVISFYFARRNFGSDIAYPLVLLLSSSPLIMAMGRRALSDSYGNLLCGLTIWLFLDFLRRENKIKYFVFLIAYTFSITVRESSIILLLFFASFFLIYKYIYKRPISNAYLLGIILLPVFLVGITYLILFKGIGNVIGIVRGIINLHFTTPPSSYSLNFCMGPWYRFIVDFILLSPITTLLFIGYFCYLLVLRKIEWGKAYFMMYFTTIFVVFQIPKYDKVVRYLINLETVIALFSVMLLYVLFRQRDEKWQMHLVFIAVFGIFLINYLSFIDIFCLNGVYDPVSYPLLVIRKFIPGLRY
ncbi:MAG: glycosyltransferase family 39 protein [Candidatus Omnitrophota bacterium]